MKRKIIIVESIATPDVVGYPDKIAVMLDDKDILYHGQCGACPNPRQPIIKGGKHWYDAYGFLSCGAYSWSCIQHRKYGKCLCLEYGAPLPARYSNVNHGGAKIISSVFVHSGFSSTWRGSAGCITIPPKDWKRFMSYFDIGENGKMRVVDYSQMSVV